jgi:membrane-associated phospholipid phosphatase
MRDKKKKTLLSAGVLCLALVLSPFQAAVWAQETPDSSRLNGAFFKRFGSDFKNVLFSPGHWHQKDILTLSVLLGTGAVIYALDKDLYDGVQELKSSSTRDASKVIKTFGNGGYLSGLMAVLYISGEVFDNTGLRKTALRSLESFLTTSAVVLSMKAVFGRSRPGTGRPSNYFRPFSLTTGETSFPSGDAAGAFAVATSIAEQTDGFVIDALAYGLAGLVSFFRVHDEKHWPSDVFVGSALGYFIAKKVSALNREKSPGQFRVGLAFSSGRRGITLSFSF